MIEYFEIEDLFIERFGGQYFSRDGGWNPTLPFQQYKLAECADRIWLESEDGSVEYLKNRHELAEIAKVDMEEFMWIKLRSKQLQRWW